MGFLKSDANLLVGCDDVYKVVAAISNTNLIVQVTYKTHNF